MPNITPVQFWEWGYSDFLSNSQRGVLAEYIVAVACDCTHRRRVEWDAYDLETKESIKIEVKSSAYLQSWHQRAHSTIRFDIAPKLSWDSTTTTSLTEPMRSADVYTFCVFETTKREFANPLDTSQWFFLVCSTQFLNQRFGNQKSINLTGLERQGLRRLLFDEIASEVKLAKRPGD
jgi:hypothetical protein